MDEACQDKDQSIVSCWYSCMKCNLSNALLPSGDRNGSVDVNTGVSTSYDSTRSSSLISEFIRVADNVELLEVTFVLAP